MSSEGTPLHGDRGAWNVMDFDTEHGKDINDSTLRRHLPLPGAAGGIAQSDGTDWQRVNSLPLADLTDATRGCIIRRGATDWEAYDASTDGAALIGDGTDIISDLTPLWKGKHAFNDGFTFNANCDGSGTFDTSVECALAGGDSGLQSFIYQTDGTGMTGTLRGAYLTASGGNTANTGTIRGAEIKARAGRPGETGNDVAVLEGFSVSSDAKTYDVTTHRGGEIILDGGAGTSALAVGLRIANNFQANRATTSYGLQIYRDSFDYTADIQLSHGHTIADGASAITFSTGLSVSGSITVSGDIDPTSASGQDLGDAAHLWDVFASYVDVPSGGWVGCAANEERILFDSSGHDIYAYVPTFYIYAETNDNALLYIRSGGANKSSSIYLYEGGTGRWLFGYAALANQFYFQQGGNDVVIFKDGLVANSLVLDPAGHIITVPDDLANALHLSDTGGLEYMRIISTNAGPAQAVVFNEGGVDVDFRVEAGGVADALVVQGSDGQITLGALGAGAVQSNAAGVLSSGPLPLTDLAVGARGEIIRRGAVDWEAYAAEANGAALVGDGTDIISDLTPAWAGRHTFNAGVELPDGQSIGITGNELLTVNAAGNFTFSGVTSVVVPDGAWVGADAACSWLFDSTNGDVTTLDRVGIGLRAPGYPLDVWLTNLANAATKRIIHTRLTVQQIAAANFDNQSAFFSLITGTDVGVANNFTQAGFEGGANISSTHAGTFWNVIGVNARNWLQAGAAGAVINFYGIQSGLTNAGANTVAITGCYGVGIQNPILGGGTITTNYGLYIFAQTAGATNYAIYSAGGNSYHAGRLAVGGTVAPLAQLHIDQSVADAAIPVAIFDQADVDQDMFEFITTIGVGNAIEAVGGKTLTTTHFIKVTLPGALTRYIPVGTIA